MFAHRVIEDIYDNLKSKAKEDVGKLTKELVAGIKGAQHFHFGSYAELAALFAYHPERKYELFTKDVQYLKLPFPRCWFDYMELYKGCTTKIGFLVEEVSDEEISVLDFIWLDGSGWLPAHYVASVKKAGLYPSGGNVKTDSIFTRKRPNTDYIPEEIFVPVALSIVEYSLRVLNCKNIQTEKIIAPKALNKKRQKSGKQELFDYHVLNVLIPAKKQEHKETMVPLSHNRVHLCRGHFKEYTAAHPLFGKLTGLYWWKPHARGQNNDGIITKEYKVGIKESK